MKNILKYIYLTAIRDWFFIALILGIFGIFGVSMLLGYTSISEQSTTQLVVFAGTTRLLILVGLIIFICFYIARSFENKEIPFFLSKNISREKFILSYWLSFNLIAQTLLIPLGILMAIFFKNINYLGLLQWFLSLSFEVMIMTTFCIAISLIIKSSTFSAMMSFGLYIISRMMGFFVDLMYTNSDNKVLSIIVEISNFIFSFISSLIPRLDLFAQTKWLVYGGDCRVLNIIILQTLIFLPILFMITFYDFKKKQF